MATVTTTNRTTVRAALLTWAKGLNRTLTKSEIKAKYKELRGRHFSEDEFSEALNPVFHTDTYQCDEYSGTLCRPLFKKSSPLWLTFFELTNLIREGVEPNGYEPIYKVTEW